MSYEAIWKFMSTGDARAMELVEFLCEKHDLYIGNELSRSLREAGSSSEFLYPSPNATDSSFKSFYDRIVSRQSSFEPKSTSLWSTIAKSGRKNGKKKKGGRASPETEAKQAEDIRPTENPEWIIPPEFLPTAKTLSTLPKEAIVSLMSKRELFLTKDRFLGIIPYYCKDNFHLLRKISPDLFDEVDEVVHRWVRVGSDDTGLSVAKGIGSIIDSQVAKELTESGSNVLMSKHNRLKELVIDTTCGFTRTSVIKGVLLKSEYVQDYGTYHNLYYSTAIHCFGLNASCVKIYERRKCQFHGVGPLDGTSGEEQHSCVRQPWVPSNYGLRTPGGLVSAMKPILCGPSLAALQVGTLCKSLISYLTSKAVLIAASFTTLHPAVQQFLISKYSKISSVPTTMISKLVGKSIKDAAELIFSAGQVDPTGGNTKGKPSGGGGSDKGANPKKSKTPPAGQGKFPYQGFTDNQVKVLTSSFGGDFKVFLALKKKHKLTGKLNLMKLSNFFKNGKPKFGKMTRDEVIAKCLN
jgi:hypothetical protein